MVYEQNMNKAGFFTKILRTARRVCGIITVPAVLMLTGCGLISGIPAEKGPVTKNDFALNTFVNVTVYDSADEELVQKAVDLCGEYEKIFSATREDSELYRLNHRDTDTVTVSEELAHVIGTGLRFSELTGGRFDITVLPLKETWGFSADGEPDRVPDENAIREALGKISYRNVSVEGNTVSFSDRVTQIDAGALAKGYIADRIKEYLLENGVHSAVINLGGNILCVGEKPDGSAFRIGIRKPFTENEVLESLEIRDESVVTSGVYERYIEADGKKYHHILDTQTGYPVETELLSASVICPDSELADVLSTVCLCMGKEEGKRIAEEFGARVIFAEK